MNEAKMKSLISLILGNSVMDNFDKFLAFNILMRKYSDIFRKGWYRNGKNVSEDFNTYILGHDGQKGTQLDKDIAYYSDLV